MKIATIPSERQLEYLRAEGLLRQPMTQDLPTGVITAIEVSGFEITRYVISPNGTAVIDWLDRPVWIKATADEDAER